MKKKRSSRKVAEIETYSDDLLMSLLRKRRPERYGDYFTVDIKIRHARARGRARAGRHKELTP